VKLTSVLRLLSPFGGGATTPPPTPTPLPSGLVTQGMGLGWLVVGGMGYRSTQLSQPLARIREAIYHAMITDSEVTAIVGTRIFPAFIPQGELLPAVAYRVQTNPVERMLSGPSDAGRAVFEVASVTKDPDDGERLAEALRRLFDGFTGVLTVPGDRSIDVRETTMLNEEDRQAVDAGDGTGEPYVATVLTYAIRYRRPIPSRF
jgi:hypothetical protein